MATNNFKAFSIGAGANVTSQADYEALAALLTGFQSGKASSAQINKALRQSSTMAYVLAQFISDSASVDVLDNGTPATIIANMKAAMTALTPGRLLNVQVITATGTYIKTPGTRNVIAKAQGGGGSGGGTATTGSNQIAGGGGGTGGAYGETSLIDVSSITSIPVVVGNGGLGVVNASGNPGGASSFGSYLLAPGGAGGVYGPANTTANSVGSDLPPSADCSGSSVALNIPGYGGETAMSLSGASDLQTTIKSGKGGDSFLGMGGRSVNGSINAGGVGKGYGAGGAGRAYGANAATAGAGANGAQGVIIVMEYA